MRVKDILKTGDEVKLYPIFEGYNIEFIEGEYIAETDTTWIIRINTGVKIEIHHYPKSAFFLVQDETFQLRTDLNGDLVRIDN